MRNKVIMDLCGQQIDLRQIERFVPTENMYPVYTVQELKEAIDREEKVDIVTLGPASNLMILLQCDPDLKEKIASVHFAGGCLRKGNLTPVSEKNLGSDPEAFEYLLNSGIKIFLYPSDLDEECEGFFSKDLTLDPYQLCAILGQRDPDLFEGMSLHAEVELNGEYTRGTLVADLKDQLQKKHNVFLITKFRKGER